MVSEGVRAALAEARTLGFLGPGPLDDQIAHSLGFGEVIGDLSGRALDLGSGGGLPGLVLADVLSQSRWTFVEVGRRRTSFLTRSVALLGWSGRVEVVRAPAELLAHDPSYRGAFALVSSRSFGPAPVTAETAAAFLEAGGRLVVADPPTVDGVLTAQRRWDGPGLMRLGLAPARHVRAQGASFAVCDRLTSATGAGPGPDAAGPRSARAMARSPAW